MAKISSRPGPHEVTLGVDWNGPPTLSQLNHWPLYQRCQSALSAPRTKTSIRSVPQETATGSEASTPPSDSQLHQVLWLYHLWISELLGPRAKTSSRPGPQDETPGPEVMVPPSDSLRIHASPAPLSGTVCGLPLPLLLMVRVPVFGPIADGRKV